MLNFITPAESFLPQEVLYSQIPGSGCRHLQGGRYSASILNDRKSKLLLKAV